MACNSLSYTPFDSVLLCLYLCVSFDLLKVGVLDGLITTLGVAALISTGIGVGLRACASTWLAGLLVHLGTGGLPCVVEFGNGGVNGGDVLSLVSILQFLQGTFDGRFLVGGKFVTEFLQLILGLENHGVGLVEFVNLLAFLLVSFGIGLGLGFHAVDFVLAQSASGFNADSLFLTGGFVLGADFQDTVGVDIEADFNLGYATAGRGDAFEVELTDALVLAGHGTLALRGFRYPGSVGSRRAGRYRPHRLLY